MGEDWNALSTALFPPDQSLLAVTALSVEEFLVAFLTDDLDLLAEAKSKIVQNDTELSVHARRLLPCFSGWTALQSRFKTAQDMGLEPRVIAPR